ncbi:MAG: winged helix-turn-helix transcriptional regulator [Nannocystales bacterium]
MKPKDKGAAEHSWTFLSNYAHVLVCLARDPDITLREVAEQVGVTERAIHRIVGELTTAGVVVKEREGRRNHYTLSLSTPLRHPLEEGKTISDLLSGLLTRSEMARLHARIRAAGGASTG